MSKPNEVWVLINTLDGNDFYCDTFVSSVNPATLSDEDDYMELKEHELEHYIEKSAYDALAAEVEHASNTAAQIAKVNIELRAENEKLKSNVIDVYNNPLHVELFAGAQRLANGILLPELEKQVEDLRTAQAELKDNLKVTNELFEAASEDIGELQSTNAELVEALKEARFVFEGSRAIDGQSDELLDKREGSIMRFLESLAKHGGTE